MKESVKLDGGKYEVILDQDGSSFNFHALRYGEEWRSLVGDNLILAMFNKIQDLEERLFGKEVITTEENTPCKHLNTDSTHPYGWISCTDCGKLLS